MTNVHTLESVRAAPVAVDEATLRRSLEQLKHAPIDPKTGLFGPDSMFWEVNRHTLVYFLGAVQSVQMQLCHPWIAVAVYEHSKIMSHPRQRQRLTYIYLWSLIYGDLDMVTKKAQALYKVHSRVEGNIPDAAGRHGAGSHYSANEVNALLWVHVTAFYCRVKMYEQLVRPLSRSELDQFCREAKLYAFCFGIPDSTHPQTWQDVEDYVAAMTASDTLARTDAGMKIRLFLERSIPRRVRDSLWNFLCVPLPQRMQALLDQPQATPENRARAAKTARRLKMLQRWLPARLACVPAYQEAMRRLQGKREPDWLTARLNQLFIGVPKLVS